MRKLTVVFILLTTFFILGAIWWINGTSASNPLDRKTYLFVVGQGEGVRSVANRLKKERLIKDPIVFFLLVNFVLNIDEKIQAGDHRISPGMTAEELGKSLTKATNDVWVTIQEGLRAEEIASILKKNIKTYKESWRETLNKNEGFLFPDTYLIPKNASLETILSILKNNFDSKYSSIQNVNKTRLSKIEIVTVASLVEREARESMDRPLVASVIFNRLDNGLKLDIDATVQYVLGYQEKEKDWWKKNLAFEDLEINSPYNTYRNAGLPPGPIANPGLAALSATVNPANSNYLYYISDKKGKNHYAETLEEHQANIKKYGL